MGRLTRIKPQLEKATPRIGWAGDLDQTITPSRDRHAPWRKLYKTERWRKLRLRILLRDTFTCRICGRLEGNTALLVCDHIKPHRGIAALFWDEANLQCLCKPCHDGIKQKEEQASMMHKGVWD
jgi:5-methylcytosine-specific restriction endonuclease McrA